MKKEILLEVIDEEIDYCNNKIIEYKQEEFDCAKRTAESFLNGKLSAYKYMKEIIKEEK